MQPLLDAWADGHDAVHWYEAGSAGPTEADDLLARDGRQVAVACERAQVSGRPRISLLVSDIDGTLVTSDKRLTEAAVAAAHRLQPAGVHLSLVSSRPPAGFAMLTGPLGMKAPIGAFNGGAILNCPDLTIIEREARRPRGRPHRARRLRRVRRRCMAVHARHLVRHRSTKGALRAEGAPHQCQIDPEVVTTVRAASSPAGRQARRLVARTFAAVAACEAALQERLGTGATAKRSQPYYLDVTPYGFDKG